MNPTPVTSDVVGPRPALAETRVRESTLRRVAQLGAAVILVAAGIMVGIYINPELAATLVAAGVHSGVDAIVTGHDDRRHRPTKGCAPAFALA